MLRIGSPKSGAIESGAGFRMGQSQVSIRQGLFELVEQDALRNLHPELTAGQANLFDLRSLIVHQEGAVSKG